MSAKPDPDKTTLPTLEALNATLFAREPLARLGRPFVGPGGRPFHRALADAGIERNRVYVTNAMKHFIFAQRGKRRIHEKPTTAEIAHYRWWLERELDLVHPRLVIALGATAGFALAERKVAVMRERGPMSFSNRPGYLSVHPSSCYACRTRRHGTGL